MDTKSANRVNMIRTTVQVCDGNTAATGGITAFAGLLTRVKSNLVLIDSLDLLIVGTSTGVTLDTNLLRTTMTNIALICANATFAYASSVNNNTLKALVNFPKSKLDGQKKDEVDDTCFGIYTAANSNIIAVTPFGIAAGDVTSLNTAIGLYRTSIQNPRQAIITKSEAVRQLDQTIRDTTQGLFKDQMDRTINTLKLSNNNFWNLYFKAREIVDLGSTTAKYRGSVSDVDGNPVPQPIVTLRIAGETDIAYQTTGADDSTFNISDIAANDYNATIEKTGFHTINDDHVHIAAGQEITRNFTMTAL